MYSVAHAPFQPSDHCKEEFDSPYSFNPKILKDYRYADYTSEQDKLDEIPAKDFVNSSFFKRFDFSKEGLYKKENLLQFLLFLNHKEKSLKKSFLVETRDHTMVRIPGLSLYELGHRRHFQSERASRKDHEDQFFSKFNFSNFSRQEALVFTITCFEGLLPEWILLSQLILLGFKKFEIHLCNDYFAPQVPDFEKFFQEFLDLKCTISQHVDMEAFAEQRIVSDVIVSTTTQQLARTPKVVDLLLSERGVVHSPFSEPHWNIQKLSAKEKLEDPFACLNKV